MGDGRQLSQSGTKPNTMKMTLTRSDIANSLESMHGTSFSHYGSLALADYLLELEDSTGEEQEFDEVAIRCEFSEFESAESWAGDYFGDDVWEEMGIDLNGDETPEKQREKLIRDYIRDHGQLIEFTGGIIVSNF
jgi:hypothetical protein